MRKGPEINNLQKKKKVKGVLKGLFILFQTWGNMILKSEKKVKEVTVTNVRKQS